MQAHPIQNQIVFNNSPINRNILKNNTQIPFSHKSSGAFSPPPGIQFTPIENSYPIPRQSPHIAGSPTHSQPLVKPPQSPHPNINTPLNFVPINHAPIHNIGNNYAAGNNVTYVIGAPQQIGEPERRRQSFNRSNKSSSRVNSQNSRISYVRVDDQPNAIMQKTDNNFMSRPSMMQQAYSSGDRKVFQNRPQSSISNQSSRNSSGQKIKIQMVTNHKFQEQSQQQIGRKPASPPKPVAQNMVIIQNQPQHLVNVHQQQIQTPVFHYQSFGSIGTPIQVSPQIQKNRQSPSPPASSYMHTSDVRVVYQRGSYSPNDNSSNETSGKFISTERALSPKPDNFNSYSRISEERSSGKISIQDLKQKKPEVIPEEMTERASIEVAKKYGDPVEDPKPKQEVKRPEEIAEQKQVSKASSMMISQEFSQNRPGVILSDNTSLTHFSTFKEDENLLIMQLDSSVPSKIQNGQGQQSIIRNAKSISFGKPLHPSQAEDKKMQENMAETRKPSKPIETTETVKMSESNRIEPPQSQQSSMIDHVIQTKPGSSLKESENLTIKNPYKSIDLPNMYGEVKLKDSMALYEASGKLDLKADSSHHNYGYEKMERKNSMELSGFEKYKMEQFSLLDKKKRAESADKPKEEDKLVNSVNKNNFSNPSFLREQISEDMQYQYSSSLHTDSQFAYALTPNFSDLSHQPNRPQSFANPPPTIAQKPETPQEEKKGQAQSKNQNRNISQFESKLNPFSLIEHEQTQKQNIKNTGTFNFNDGNQNKDTYLLEEREKYDEKRKDWNYYGGNSPNYLAYNSSTSIPIPASNGQDPNSNNKIQSPVPQNRSPPEIINNRHPIPYQKMVDPKDRIFSQKIIHRESISNNGGLEDNSYQHHRSSTFFGIPERPSHGFRHVQNGNIQNEEENDPEEDVYELIEAIYNRELENGLMKIRQTFGAVMSNLGKAHSQFQYSRNRYN